MSTSFTDAAEVSGRWTPASLLGWLEARERAAKSLVRRWIVGLCCGGGELARGGQCWSVCCVEEGYFGLVLVNGFMSFCCKWQRLERELAGFGRASG